jgi:arsenate reductase
MGEGLLRALYGQRYEVHSAGIEASHVDSHALKAMSEIGIDISDQYSKNMNEYQGILFDVAVTLCDEAKESCPICGVSLEALISAPAAKRTIHKTFKDPATMEGSEEDQLAAFRQVRDEIRNWIDQTFGAK